MIARTGSGWQYLLADLSLILFMITAAALARTMSTPATSQPKPARQEALPSPQGEPLARYRAEPGAPPLARWLAEQSMDERQQLTIVAQFVPGGQAAALAKAQALVREAGGYGARARMLVEPGEGGTTVTLAFDVPQAAQAPLARNLLNPGMTDQSQGN